MFMLEVHTSHSARCKDLSLTLNKGIWNIKTSYGTINRCIHMTKCHLRLIFIFTPLHFLLLHSQVFSSSHFVHVYRHLQVANTCMKQSTFNLKCSTWHAYQFVLWNWSNWCTTYTSTKTATPIAHKSHVLSPRIKIIHLESFLHSYKTAHVSFDENQYRNML